MYTKEMIQEILYGPTGLEFQLRVYIAASGIDLLDVKKTDQERAFLAQFISLCCGAMTEAPLHSTNIDSQTYKIRKLVFNAKAYQALKAFCEKNTAVNAKPLLTKITEMHGIFNNPQFLGMADKNIAETERIRFVRLIEFLKHRGDVNKMFYDFNLFFKISDRNKHRNNTFVSQFLAEDYKRVTTAALALHNTAEVADDVAQGSAKMTSTTSSASLNSTDLSVNSTETECVTWDSQWGITSDGAMLSPDESSSRGTFSTEEYFIPKDKKSFAVGSADVSTMTNDVAIKATDSTTISDAANSANAALEKQLADMQAEIDRLKSQLASQATANVAVESVTVSEVAGVPAREYPDDSVLNLLYLFKANELGELEMASFNEAGDYVLDEARLKVILKVLCKTDAKLYDDTIKKITKPENEYDVVGYLRDTLLMSLKPLAMTNGPNMAYIKGMKTVFEAWQEKYAEQIAAYLARAQAKVRVERSAHVEVDPDEVIEHTAEEKKEHLQHFLEMYQERDGKPSIASFDDANEFTFDVERLTAHVKALTVTTEVVAKYEREMVKIAETFKAETNVSGYLSSVHQALKKVFKPYAVDEKVEKTFWVDGIKSARSLWDQKWGQDFESTLQASMSRQKSFSTSPASSVKMPYVLVRSPKKMGEETEAAVSSAHFGQSLLRSRDVNTSAEKASMTASLSKKATTRFDVALNKTYKMDALYFSREGLLIVGIEAIMKHLSPLNLSSENQVSLMTRLMQLKKQSLERSSLLTVIDEVHTAIGRVVAHVVPGDTDEQLRIKDSFDLTQKAWLIKYSETIAVQSLCQFDADGKFVMPDNSKVLGQYLAFIGKKEPAEADKITPEEVALLFTAIKALAETQKTSPSSVDVLSFIDQLKSAIDAPLTKAFPVAKDKNAISASLKAAFATWKTHYQENCAFHDKPVDHTEHAESSTENANFLQHDLAHEVNGKALHVKQDLTVKHEPLLTPQG